MKLYSLAASAIIIILSTTPDYLLADTNSGNDSGPLSLTFHRLAARRFLLSNNLPIASLEPREIVALESMHPAFLPSGDGNSKPATTPETSLAGGTLLMKGAAPGAPSCVTTRYVGGVNPFATYEIALHSVKAPGESIPVEVGIDLATLGLGSRVQVVARYGLTHDGVVMRLIHDGKTLREQVLWAGPAPTPPCKLQVQLSGMSLSAFVSDADGTRYLGHTLPDENFRDVIDFRDIRVAASSTANLFTSVPPEGSVAVDAVREYLSPGVGQADIRLITREDGSPYREDSDGGRLWFSFSCRGLNIGDAVQGVLSLDPSLFDPRFEGMIVYDHGDGLLRNDYSSCIFRDGKTGEWRALACDFGGTAGKEGRSGSGLLTAVSSKDPRHGFTIFRKAGRLKGIAGSHEDPCLIHDDKVGKWRLLTCEMSSGMHTRLFESDFWNGPFHPITRPSTENSTGVQIQRIGEKYYCFSGSNEHHNKGPIIIYSYPDLKKLGTLKIDLPPHWPENPGRIWPNIVPLPEGYPFSYMALMMDRPNFPGVRGPNWSYGSLYFFGSVPKN